MTEADARVLLRNCGGFGGLEAWITGRRLRTVPGGRIVTGELQSWSFQLEPAPLPVHRHSLKAPHEPAP